jgi:hypothetical protein
LIRQIFRPCLFDCLFVQIQTKIKNNNKKEQNENENENENEKQRHLLIYRKNDINANSICKLVANLADGLIVHKWNPDFININDLQSLCHDY